MISNELRILVQLLYTQASYCPKPGGELKKQHNFKICLNICLLDHCVSLVSSHLKFGCVPCMHGLGFNLLCFPFAHYAMLYVVLLYILCMRCFIRIDWYNASNKLNAVLGNDCIISKHMHHRWYMLNNHVAIYYVVQTCSCSW